MAENQSILDRYQLEIATKAALSLDGLLIFLEHKKFITPVKADQIKNNNNDDKTTRIYRLISLLKTQRAEEDILAVLIDALKYVRNDYLVKELEKELSHTESERRLEDLETEIQALDQKRTQLASQKSKLELDIEEPTKRDEKLKMDKERSTATDSLEREVKRLSQEKEALRQEWRQETARFKQDIEILMEENKRLGQENEMLKPKQSADATREEKQRAEHNELDNIPPCSSNASATNGALLCIGGYGPGSFSIEVYKTTSDRWILIDREMCTLRENFGAVSVGSKM